MVRAPVGAVAQVGKPRSERRMVRAPQGVGRADKFLLVRSGRLTETAPMSLLSFGRRLVWSAAVCGLGLHALAAAPPPLDLPRPQTDGGRPLMQVLRDRKSTREFSARPIEPQLLSNLLWAGCGVNRPASGHRTAPSAMNAQEIALYVATADGVYRYEAAAHRLEPVVEGDLRSLTGGQAWVRETPLALVFVADLARLAKAKPEDKEFYAAIDAGFIVQNLYLFCASEGLATVVHDLDRAPLAQALKLRPGQKIIITQSVGHPKS